MNRADQAPEPSMEELLASIRLIISDADKKGPAQRDSAHPRLSAGEGSLLAGPGAAIAGDEVLDLTDELVFPDERPAPRGGTRLGQSKLEDRPGQDSLTASGHKTPPDSGPLPLPAPEAANRRHSESPQAVRQQYGLPPASRPLWSRRELAAPSQTPAPKPRQDATPARPQTRNWAADIQMPVPNEGPVSLIPSASTKSSLTEPVDATGGNTGGQDREQGHGGHAGRWNGKNEAAAVAALAKRLARSAMGAMEASELENAQAVDFEHIDGESRAAVTGKFADAIERESSAHGTSQLPSLLDEVFRQEFIRDPEPGDEPAEEETAYEAYEETIEAPVPAEEMPSDGPAGDEGADVNVEFEEEPEPAPQALREESVRHVTIEPASPQPSASAAKPEQPQRATAEPIAPQPVNAPAPIPAPALAQAQFLGTAQPAMTAQGSSSLEGAVREMLRPLLVQWLNENMPRILENAIREEIAVRGLLPKSDG